MCGRYVSPDEAAVERAWHIGRRNWKTPFGKPRYNVAPTMRVIMLRRDAASPEIELAHARWGFVPYWWKEEKPPRGRFNAKVETAASNGLWREAFSRARCLLPALGWYEWREEMRLDKATGEVVKVNQPYYFAGADRSGPGGRADRRARASRFRSRPRGARRQPHRGRQREADRASGSRLGGEFSCGRATVWRRRKTGSSRRSGRRGRGRCD